MKITKKVERLLFLFYELKEIMINENEDNWIKGINAIILSLTPPEYGGQYDIEKGLLYTIDTYTSIEAGNGSFSDFYIWRENFDERRLANEQLSNIKNEIWKIITDIRYSNKT